MNNDELAAYRGQSNADASGVEGSGDEGKDSAAAPKWDYALVSVIDEEPWISEAMWEQGDEGWELVSAYSINGSVKLYFKRKSDNEIAQDAMRYRRLRENWIDCDELGLHGRLSVIDAAIDRVIEKAESK
jgi:hypothetical protein